MTDAERVWHSSPGAGHGRHILTITRQGRRVTRTVSFPEQPEREDTVQSREARNEDRAEVLFNAWCRVVPQGYQPMEGAGSDA